MPTGEYGVGAASKPLAASSRSDSSRVAARVLTRRLGGAGRGGENFRFGQRAREPLRDPVGQLGAHRERHPVQVRGLGLRRPCALVRRQQSG